MPLVRFIRGVVWNREPHGPGDVLEVNDKDALILCDHYKDAVRVTGEAPKVSGMTVRDQITTRDPEAAHRDPVVNPQKRKDK